MTRRWAGVVGVLAVAVVLLPLPAAHAASGGQLGLSIDGRTWTRNLTRPLFDPTIRWVPGDVRTASFWARNQSSDPGRLSIRVTGGPATSLARTGNIRVRVDGRTVALSGSGTVVTDRLLQPGRRQRVPVSVAFLGSSTNPSQARQLGVRFLVRLTQAGIGGRHGSAGGTSPGGTSLGEPSRGGDLLPNTGGPPLWPAAVAAGSLLAGAAVLRRTRAGGGDG